MSIFFSHNEQSITLSGKTYQYRNSIKSLGGRFDGARKVWEIPYSSDRLGAVEKFCAGLGGGKLPVIQSVEAAGDRQIVDNTCPDSVTVGQLVAKAEAVVSNAFPQAIWVIGELQSLGTRGMGIFFSLAEQAGDSQQTISVQGVCWRQNLEQLRAKHGKDVVDGVLQEGMKVRLHCQVQFYRGRGQLSLLVLGLDPSFTRGELALQREQLLKELRAQDLHVRNRGLPLSAMPFRVGLITAPGSRAYGDFTHQLADGGFCGTVAFFPSAMQGQQTVEEVCRGIQALVECGVDLIVVTRGGGSAADLRWFDAREISFAIARAPVPVIAAIGHHDDICVAEEIAYARRKTPTAAADFVIERFADVRTRLQSHFEALDRATMNRLLETTAHLQRLWDFWQQVSARCLDACQQELHDHAATLERSLLRGWERDRQDADRTDRKLAEAWWAQLARARESRHALEFLLVQRCAEYLTNAGDRLAVLEKQLTAHDPSGWLQRGWTQLFGSTGQVASIDQVRVGDRLTAQLRDGAINVEVLERQTKHD